MATSRDFEGLTKSSRQYLEAQIRTAEKTLRCEGWTEDKFRAVAVTCDTSGEYLRVLQYAMRE